MQATARTTAEAADAAAPKAERPAARAHAAAGERDRRSAARQGAREPASADDAAVAQLVRALAPLLGLDPARIDVRARAPSSTAHAARIDVARPEAPEVVHELAHAAQHANRALRRAPRDATRAEAEAAALAARWRGGGDGRLWLPRTALPDGRAARRSDATGVAEQAAPDVSALAAELERLVAANHAGESRRILDELGAFWSTTSEKVEASLRVLATLPFVSARALVRSLPVSVRLHLAHLSDAHHAAHPVAALAVLSALTAEELMRLEADERSAGWALRGLDDARLEGDPERRALHDLLARVQPPLLLRLMRGDRRETFRRMVAIVPPSGGDADALQRAIDAERRLTWEAAGVGDGPLLAAVTADLRAASATTAAGALERLRPLTSAVAALTAPAPATATATATAPAEVTDAPAATAGPAAPAPATPPAGGSAPPIAAAAPTGTNAPPTPPERLRALVGRLDAAGLVDRLLDALPAADRYRPATLAPVLGLVLAARNPALNFARAESLLSYGLFDWVIFDGEARFAYLLVRSAPVTEQDAWRRRDGSLWFDRLTSNLPAEMLASGEYTGVGSEFGTGPPRPDGAPDTTVLERYTTLLAAWQAAQNAAGARTLTRRLIGLDPVTRQPADGAGADRPVRVAVTRRLDAGEHLVAVVGALADDDVLGEEGRGELLELSSMRDPLRVERHAAALLGTGLFDWWISSREAWTAYQMLRALPPADQQRFAAEDAGRWSGMRAAMTEEMRRSMAATVTTGRGPWPGRDQLRERLSDGRLWTREHAAELRALVLLAHVSDDRAWVFARSREVRADLVAGLEELVDDLGLYDEAAGRRVYVPEELATRHGFLELLRFVDDQLYVRWLLVAVGAWLVMDWVRIGGYSVAVRDFDLDWAQWAAGGDLGGARLARDPPPTPGVVRPPPVRSNRLSVRADLGTGAVQVDLPRLRLESTNFMRGGASYRTGPVSVDGLSITASFSDRGYHRPVGVAAYASDLDVRDLVVADPALPSGAWALARLGVRPLSFRAGATGEEDMSAIEPRTGTIPIPLFGPLFQALANVVAIRGSVPFAPTLVDLMLKPATSGMDFLASTAVHQVANRLMPSPSPADYLWGLASDGVLRPPRTAAARAEDAAAMLRSFELSFDRLQIDGLSFGAGQQARSLVLTDVTLGAATSRPAYLRLVIGSLRRSLRALPDADATQVRARIAELETELGTLEQDERRLEELEGRDRWNPEALNAAERAELARLSDRLRADTGVVADVGRIELGPLSGRIASGGVEATGIHVEAQVPLGLGAYLPDTELIARLRAGGPLPSSAAALAARADARISVASARLLAPAGGGPALSVAVEQLPTVADLRARLATMPATVPAVLRARVADALALLEENDRLRALPPAEGAAAVERRQQLRVNEDRARRLLGTEVGTLTLGRITGGLDASGTAIVARVQDVEATGLRGDGWAVDRVTGELRLGIGGLDRLTGDARGLDLATARRTLAATFGADLTGEGVALETGTLGRVAVSGLRGEVRERGAVLELSQVWADRLELERLHLGVPGWGLSAAAVTLEGIGLDAELHRADGVLARAVLPRLEINRISATELVYDSQDEEGTLRVELRSGALGGVRGEGIELARGTDGWNLATAGVSVAGIEDLRYRVVLGALTGGTHQETLSVTGTLAGGTMPAPTGPLPAAASATPTLLRARLAITATGARTVSLAAQDLRALGTTVRTPDGSVHIRRATISGTLDRGPAGTAVTARLGDLDIGRLRWRAGTLRIAGDGTIALRSVEATVTLDAADPGSPDPARRVARLRVDDLDIRDVRADDLRITDPPLDLRLGSSAAGVHTPGALRVGRIRLRDFVLPYRPEGTLSTTPTGGSLGVTGAHVDFTGTVAAGVRATGNIDADSISVDFLRGGALVARARGVSGGAAIDAGGQQLTVGLQDLDTGAITVGDDAIRVDGLHLPMLTLDDLRLSSTSPPLPFELESLPAGSIYVLGLGATVRIERWRPGEAHPATMPFRRIVVERLAIDRIDVEGLVLRLPGHGVVVTVPVLPAPATGGLPPIASLRNITLDTDFVITPGGPELFRGVARLDSAVVPRLEAEVAGRFSGAVELSAGAASIGFLARGDTVVDIANPRARMTTAATLGSAAETILVEELGAESVHVAGGTTTIRGAFADRLSYGAPGVTVTVERIRAPGDVTASSAAVTIPELGIDGAHLRIDFTRLPAGGGGGSGSGHLVRPADLEQVYDALQGDLSLVVFMRVRVPTMDDQDLRIPVRLHFVDGRLDFQELQSSLQGAIGAKDADEADDTSHTVEFFASRPEFWFERQTDLVFGLHLLDVADPDGHETTPVVKELVRWRLPTDEIRRAQGEHLVRLGRIIDPVPTASDPDEPSSIFTDTIELRDIDANLSIRSTAVMPLHITSPSATGTVTLAPDALIGLRAGGFIPGATRPAARPSLPGPGGLRAISADQINFASVDLTITGAGTVQTDAIEIRDLTDGSLTFSGHTPQVLDARVTRAVARNIRWRRTP